MPLVKLNLRKGRSTDEEDAIGASVQAALVSNLGVPETGRYQLFAEYDTKNFRHTGGHIGLIYTDQLLISMRSPQPTSPLARAARSGLTSTRAGIASRLTPPMPTTATQSS